MTVSQLISKSTFSVINQGNNQETQITKPFCCDLLSFAMSKASEGDAWITVMGNINTLAVAVLAEVSCIILAENVDLDEASHVKAKQQGLTILKTSKPIFEASLEVYNLING